MKLASDKRTFTKTNNTIVYKIHTSYQHAAHYDKIKYLKKVRLYFSKFVE